MLDSLISGVSPIEDSKLLNAVYYEITRQVRHARIGNSKLLSAALKQGDTTRLLPISNFHDHARFPNGKHSTLSAISKLSNKKYPMYHTHYGSTP